MHGRPFSHHTGPAWWILWLHLRRRALDVATPWAPGATWAKGAAWVRGAAWAPQPPSTHGAPERPAPIPAQVGP